jgi:hypothetical protein
MTTSSVGRRVGRVSLLALTPLLGAGVFAGPALADGAAKVHTDHAVHADHGLVTAVAGNDSLIRVKTSDHGVLTLEAGKSLRHTVDAVSVTDYVVFTYGAAHKDKLELKTLHDTSVAASGKVSEIASSHKFLTVKTAAHESLKLHVSKPSLLDGIKLRESVDIDYYTAADGELVLVNIDRKAPIGATGTGTGTGTGKKGSAGSGSAGSSGSGSAGSGSAGSGSAGSGSAGSGSFGSAA